MCEMLNTEPKEDEIPVEREDLFLETQEVFNLFDKLPARWEGFSGHYLGKDLTILPVLFDEFNIEEYTRLYAWDLIPYIDSILAEDIANKIKAKSRKGATSGKDPGSVGAVT